MTERGLEVTHHCDAEDMRETPPDSDDKKRAGGRESAANAEPAAERQGDGPQINLHFIQKPAAGQIKQLGRGI